MDEDTTLLNAINSWRYLFRLIREGYEVRISEDCFSRNYIRIELSKGNHHRINLISQETINLSLLGDDFSIINKILEKMKEELDFTIKRSVEPFEKPLATEIKWGRKR